MLQSPRPLSDINFDPQTLPVMTRPPMRASEPEMQGIAIHLNFTSYFPDYPDTRTKKIATVLILVGHSPRINPQTAGEHKFPGGNPWRRDRGVG